VRIHRQRTERKIKDVFGDEFGFRRGKRNTDALGMLRISKLTFDIDKELLRILAEDTLPCKLDQINADPKHNWYQLVVKKRLISKFHKVQCVEV